MRTLGFLVQKNNFTFFESLNLFLAPISQTRNKIKALLNHFVPYERTLVYFLFVNFWDPHFFQNFRFSLVGYRHVRSLRRRRMPMQKRNLPKNLRNIFWIAYRIFSVQTKQKYLSPSKLVFPSFQGSSTIFDNGIFHS